MLDDNQLQKWNASTELPMLAGKDKKLSGMALRRQKLCDRIDEFWVYYQNPEKFSYEKKRKDPLTGQRESIFITGVWRDKYPIVDEKKGMLRIRLRHKSKFLPLTKGGETEIYMPPQHDTRKGTMILEDLLATIKESILAGKYDDYL